MRPLVVSVALSTVALTAAALAGTTAASAHPSAAAHGHAKGAKTKVIVLLRDQHAALPAKPSLLGRRRAAVEADQSPVRAQIADLGGRTRHAYTAVNAVAATVPAGALDRLRADPAVKAVVPDLPISMSTTPAITGTPKSAKPADSTGAAYCPTRAATPQLEPEALQLTHTDSDGTDPTARSLGYTGSGVKVGFIADGTDIDQPDLIRADGTHVVTDYQDFSGDGTASSSSGAEAMGDVGSIAAQGRTTYNISKFVNPAHPLPKGCTIRVEGMAPGASVVALKIFSNNLLTAPTSTIVQAIDYAVSTAHVNVLNESFGANPYPDTALDPISIANQNAIDAGVSVTASTGDSGTGNTLGTASTDPNVIAAAASTSERVYAQTGTYAFGLSNGKYTSDQVSDLSSGGISQTNRVPDLLAPGDLNWSLCSNRLLPGGDPQYYSCTDDNGRPSNIQVFGGTSESAPLTAGAAALVIQAYRAGHGGATPTPAEVRTILTSSTDDLGLPAQEQGTGLLNTYRAVQLAHDFDSPTATGQELSSSVPQVSNVATAGSTVTNTVTLTNNGAGPQTVTAATRHVARVSGRQTQRVPFDATTLPVFYDVIGRARPYTTKTFTVPAGTDRLDLALSVAGNGQNYVRASVLDPQGTFTAYTLPQGTNNYAHVDVHQPAPGTWTAIIWSGAPTASVSGPISLITTDYVATPAGTVTPASATIPAGSSQDFTVTTTAPAAEATATSVVFTHRFGLTTTVPIVDRAVQAVAVGSPATFAGRFDQANGRDFSPAQSFTYFVDVPSGAKDLEVNVALSGTPSNQIIAHLSDPSGEPVSTGRNDLPTDGDPADSSYPGLQLVHANPVPGRYQLTLELQNQTSGAALPLNFTGSFVLNGARIGGGATLPLGNTVISKSSSVTRNLTIYNQSPTPQTYFVDGRSTAQANYRLVASNVEGDAPDTTDPYTRTVPFPLASDDIVPAWLVPTQGSSLSVGSSSTDPVIFDLMPLDGPTTLNAPNNPDTLSTVNGRSASATHSASEVGSTQWAAFPSPYGPVGANPSPSGTVSMQATLRARAFDPAVTSSTGDPLLATVDADAPAASPITIPAGGHATIAVTFTPKGAVGSRQAGAVFVDIAQPFGPQGYSTLTEEVAALPYRYTVGS